MNYLDYLITAAYIFAAQYVHFPLTLCSVVMQLVDSGSSSIRVDRDCSWTAMKGGNSHLTCLRAGHFLQFDMRDWHFLKSTGNMENPCQGPHMHVLACSLNIKCRLMLIDQRQVTNQLCGMVQMPMYRLYQA